MGLVVAPKFKSQLTFHSTISSFHFYIWFKKKNPLLFRSIRKNSFIRTSWVFSQMLTQKYSRVKLLLFLKSSFRFSIGHSDGSHDYSVNINNKKETITIFSSLTFWLINTISNLSCSRKLHAAGFNAPASCRVMLLF